MPIKGKKLTQNAYIYTMQDCIDEMLFDFENGKEKGSTTHIPLLDNAWTWRLTESNIWSGISNTGKSEAFRFLTLIKCLESNWNAVFCAPEDYPPKEFYDGMIHTLIGLPTDKDHPMCMNKEMYQHAYNVLKDHFHFVYLRQGHNTVTDCLKEFEKLMDQYDIQIALIDPLMKFSRPKEAPERDDLYAGYLTSMVTDFAREKQCSMNIVVHQQTPKVQENGLYPAPNMYAVRGGGALVDGIDNFNLIGRPLLPKDQKNPLVQFTSGKIKKQKLVGIPQTIEFHYDRKSNRYKHIDGSDVYNFDKWF